MRRISTILTICALILVGGFSRADEKKPAAKPAKAKAPVHVVVTPPDIKWGEGPPSLPPGSKLAVLSGNPDKTGLCTLRAKLPDGYKIPAHWHPTTEYVTVISGTLYMGTGEKLEESKGHAMEAGSFGAIGAKTHHFAWATGDTEIQVHLMGPFAITYINPADDPRKAAGAAAEKK